MSNVLIFPGQGSQKVGMITALKNGFKSGMETVEEIENSISFNISKIIEEGPLEELTKTENAQIAIFTAGMVCIKILEKEYGFNIKKECKYLAGHSLGEYTALCAAGVFSISDASKIIKARGELMSKSIKNPDDFLMAAVLGLEAKDIEKLIKGYESGRNICVIANDNSPTQVVLSGHKQAVLEIGELAKKNGAMKIIPLNTSGPFHSPLMTYASIECDKILSNKFVYNDFNVPVVMNTTAKPLNKKEELHNYLVRQMTSRVRWRETIDFFIDDPDVNKIIEISPGKVLSNMAKRTYPNSNIFNIETVSQIEEFIKSE